MLSRIAHSAPPSNCVYSAQSEPMLSSDIRLLLRPLPSIFSLSFGTRDRLYSSWRLIALPFRYRSIPKPCLMIRVTNMLFGELLHIINASSIEPGTDGYGDSRTQIGRFRSDIGRLSEICCGMGRNLDLKIQGSNLKIIRTFTWRSPFPLEHTWRRVHGLSGQEFPCLPMP